MQALVILNYQALVILTCELAVDEAEAAAPRREPLCSEGEGKWVTHGSLDLHGHDSLDSAVKLFSSLVILWFSGMTSGVSDACQLSARHSHNFTLAVTVNMPPSLGRRECENKIIMRVKRIEVCSMQRSQVL